LRQLFYRLVSAEIVPNTVSAYKTLSRCTAVARREGRFPDLLDRGRQIHRYTSFTSPSEAREWLQSIYRRPRDEGQDWTIYLGVEKVGQVEQLMAWFGDLGIAVVPLGGYPSQTYVDDIRSDVERQGRTSALIYAGDFDPSGEDIYRDFLKRTDCWDDPQRIALTPQQVRQYRLPPLPGKPGDSRAAGFIERHGRLMQVELDALDPHVLRQLFRDALETFWDMSTHEKSLRREKRERRQI
jgi:hypothetical protein